MRSTRERHPLSLAVFDLDGLKAANDTLGHATGDAILRNAVRLLRDTGRATDACFRLGGDEFAAILPGISEDGARQVANRYCASLVDARLAGGPIGVSAGVAGARQDDSLARSTQATARPVGSAGVNTEHSTPEALVERADAAMYEHKRSNREAQLAADSSPCIPMRVPTLMR